LERSRGFQKEEQKISLRPVRATTASESAKKKEEKETKD
jgi:hypothetical protein